jgi:hypothetical protein
MIGISKGDIVFEPLELLIEALMRAGGKALLRTFPTEPIDQWGWPQWLWLFVILILLALILRAAWRALGGSTG